MKHVYTFCYEKKKKRLVGGLVGKWKRERERRVILIVEIILINDCKISE